MVESACKRQSVENVVRIPLTLNGAFEGFAVVAVLPRGCSTPVGLADARVNGQSGGAVLLGEVPPVT